MTINETKRNQAIRWMLEYADEDGNLPVGTLSAGQRLYECSRNALRTWWRQSLEQQRAGMSPFWTPPCTRNPFIHAGEDYSETVLVALKSSATQRSAWEQLSRRGFYTRSLDQFRVDIKTLNPPMRAFIEGGPKALFKHGQALRYPKTYVGGTYVYDHTEADIWVVPASNRKPIRPVVSFVVDQCSNRIMTFVVSQFAPGTEYIRAMLAESFQIVDDVASDGEIIQVGGIPGRVVYDNALAHSASPVTKFLSAMGIVMDPIDVRQSYQQGRVESKNKLLSDFVGTLPGNTRSSLNAFGQPSRYKQDGKGQTLSDDILSLKALVMRLSEWVDAHNRKGPNDAWQVRQTDLAGINEQHLLAGMMQGKRQYTITSDGVHFEGRDYILENRDKFTAENRKVEVFSLPRKRDWILIQQGNVTSKAWFRESLPEHVRNAILANRRKAEKSARKLDLAVSQRDALIASHLNAAAEGYVPNIPLLDVLADPANAPQFVGDATIEHHGPDIGVEFMSTSQALAQGVESTEFINGEAAIPRPAQKASLGPSKRRRVNTLPAHEASAALQSLGGSKKNNDESGAA